MDAPITVRTSEGPTFCLESFDGRPPTEGGESGSFPD